MRYNASKKHALDLCQNRQWFTMGLPAGFLEDLKMVVLAWRFVPTYIEEWKCEEHKYLACWRMKIINCHICWRWRLHFQNCWRLKIWRLLLKNVKKMKTTLCAGSPYYEAGTHFIFKFQTGWVRYFWGFHLLGDGGKEEAGRNCILWIQPQLLRWWGRYRYDYEVYMSNFAIALKTSLNFYWKLGKLQMKSKIRWDPFLRSHEESASLPDERGENKIYQFLRYFS